MICYNQKFQGVKASGSNRCKRCHQQSADAICQTCKSALLTNFEATADWQTAFEIEKAQLTAARYQRDFSEDNEMYY